MEEAPAGVVYAYQRGADNRWSEAPRFTAPASASGDVFGAAIAMDEDRALVGAPLATGNDGATEAAGRVFQYSLRDGAWQLSGELATQVEAEASFGSTVVMGDDRALIGAPNAGLGLGAAYLYRAAETGNG